MGKDEILRMGSRMVVPEDEELRKDILRESHRSRFTIHPGGNKMYQDIKRTFWLDVRDAIVILVLKAVNKAASSQRGLRPRHSRDKENACTAGVTMDGPTDLCSANHRPGWTVAFQL